MAMTDRGRSLGMTAFAALVVAGCSSARLGPSDGSVERSTRIRELQDEVAGLEAERSRLCIELEMAKAASPEGVTLTGLPTPVRVAEASGSTVRLDPSGAELRLRVRTEDARNRFLQTTGPATVSAIGFDAAGDAVELGTWDVDAVRWGAGLREGFMGTAYAIDLPINASQVSGLGGDSPKVLVRIEIMDPRATTPYRLEFAVPVTGAVERNSS